MRSIHLQKSSILLYLITSLLLFVGSNAATSMITKGRHGNKISSLSSSPTKSKVRSIMMNTTVSKGRKYENYSNTNEKFKTKGNKNKYVGLVKATGSSSFSPTFAHPVRPSTSSTSSSPSPQTKGKMKGSNFFNLPKGQQKETKWMNDSKGQKGQQQYHKGSLNASPHSSPTLTPMTDHSTNLSTSVHTTSLSKGKKHGINKGKIITSKGENQGMMKGTSLSSPKQPNAPTLYPQVIAKTKGSSSKGYQKGKKDSKEQKGRKRRKGQYKDSKGSHYGKRPSKSPSVQYNPEDPSLHPSSYYYFSSLPTEDLATYDPSFFPTHKSPSPSSQSSSTPSNDPQSSLPTNTMSVIPSMEKVFPPIPISNLPTKHPSPRPSYKISSSPTKIQLTQTPSYVPFLTCKDNEMRFVLNLTPPNGSVTSISWTLQNCSTGKIVLRGQRNGIRVCIPKDQYAFTIFNNFGSGLCCNDGFGYYEIYVDDGLIRDGGQFTFEETTIFGPSSYSSSSSMRPKSPTKNPSTFQSMIESAYPTTSTEESIISESLIFSDLVLNLSFPIKRRLENYPYSSTLDRRFLFESDENGSLLLDEEELYGIIYKLLSEDLQEAFNPHFLALIISLTRQRDKQNVDEIKALFQLKGKVIFQFKSIDENSNKIPSQAQLDQRILKTLERQDFLQSLQMSSDPRLASTSSVTIAFDSLIGKSTFPEELPPVRGDGFLRFVLVVAIICCILTAISLVFCYLHINKRRFVGSSVHQVLDDCSTSSPGSNQHYSSGINVLHSDGSSIDLSNAVKNDQNSMNSISQSSPSNCQRTIGEIEENAHKAESDSLDATKNTLDFDQLWDSKHNTSRVTPPKGDTSKVSSSQG